MASPALNNDLLILRTKQYNEFKRILSEQLMTDTTYVIVVIAMVILLSFSSRKGFLILATMGALALMLFNF